MKKTFTCLLLFFGFFCSAQNYNCFVPGKRQYFTNDNNYLRGIRIDSVVANGTDTIYYPFHTPRGNYYYLIGTTPLVLDSTGGSWVGKQIIKQQDGTFLFDNIWGDTAVIKTQANIGDTWVFYNDTSSRYYMATVTATDTMTIEGNVDSVKTISITAYINGAVNTGDSVNNFQFTLSKNNGFAKVFDLYTFPYHAPDTNNYGYGKDFYLDYVMNVNYATNYFFPSIKNINFKRISFVNYTYAQLYDWNVGDVYEYKGTPAYAGTTNGTYYVDTIKTKSVNATNTTYTFEGRATIYPPNNNSNTYNTYPISGSLTYPDIPIIDTTLMPEEYQQPDLYYYYPNDTSFCYTSPAFDIPENLLHGNVYANDLTIQHNTYKLGIGRTYFDATIHEEGAMYPPIDTILLYVYKNGQSCGTYDNTSVHNLHNSIEINSYPNPATNELNFFLSNTNHATCSVSLINTLGQVIRTTTTSEEKITINVSNIPNGLYDVMIVSEDGERVNGKVVVDH